MAENTKIEWADHTWSPVWGCTQVSKVETGGGGCDNCYAMTLAHRFGTGWNGAPMREFGDRHWNEPVRWNKRAAASGKRPKVFPSMCDPLDKDWPIELRERFWRLVEATPNLTWLILTKRIGNAERLGPGAIIGRWPSNVWLGATVVNQAEADRDIPKLLEVPAAKRFLSIEPMLGPISFEGMFASTRINDGTNVLEALDWVIVGGESGRGARPMHPDWARGLRDQCEAAGTPFLFKQWGEWVPVTRKPAGTNAWITRTREGVISHKLAVSPFGDSQLVAPMGKTLTGRLLDGIEHNGFPHVATTG